MFFIVADATLSLETKKKRKVVTKHHWTSQEETELKTLFPRTFEDGKLPGQREIKAKFKSSEVFKDVSFTLSAIKNKLIRMLEGK